MSITLVTGVPGSGKTLYTVSKLLQPLLGSTVKVSGKQDVDRIIYTNINGLLIDHDLIDGGDSYGLRDWHKWGRAGAIVCFDEFQKVWPPRPNGSKIPEDIQALDTHRHKGVDFILITQNCMNVDRHILGLVDRHLHIRRVANMAAAVVYEWDHASRQLRYKDAMTKSPWRYDKGAYKLYKSAEVHTKQHRKMPGLVWFIAAGLAGAAYLIPTFIERFTTRMAPDKVQANAEQPTDQKIPDIGQTVTYSKDGIKYTVETTKAPEPESEPEQQSLLNSLKKEVQFSGCARAKDRCTCFDTAGQPYNQPLETCNDMTGKGRGKPLQFTEQTVINNISYRIN